MHGWTSFRRIILSFLLNCTGSGSILIARIFLSLWVVTSPEWFSVTLISFIQPKDTCLRWVNSFGQENSSFEPQVSICLPACWVTSVVSDFLRPRGLWPARLLCPWDSLGRNTGVGFHFLLQIFPTQGWNLQLVLPLLWQAGSLPLVTPRKQVKRKNNNFAGMWYILDF